MKIGFCAKPDQAALVKAAGFDYIELPVNYVASLTEEDFEAVRKTLDQAALPAPAFNLLFPKELALLAPGTEDGEICAYLRRAFERVRTLGGKTAVFGSGKSRQRPESMPYAEAFRRLAEVTRLTGETAGEFGITVVIEPLNRGETNMIHTVGEGACLAAAVNHPNVRVLADYYHIMTDGDHPEDIASKGGIAHAHIATEGARLIPLTPEEGYRAMFRAMKATNYQGLLSVEGKSGDLAAEGPVSVAMLKSLWEEA